MSKVIKNKVAFDEEIYKRASKIAKEKYDMEISEEGMADLDQTVKKYINSMKEDPNMFGVYLHSLGRAYYTIPGFKKLYKTPRTEVQKSKIGAMEAHYQNNDSRKNRLAGFRSLHSERPLTMRALRRTGKRVSDIEKIQNKIT